MGWSPNTCISAPLYIYIFNATVETYELTTLTPPSKPLSNVPSPLPPANTCAFNTEIPPEAQREGKGQRMECTFECNAKHVTNVRYVHVRAIQNLQPTVPVFKLGIRCPSSQAGRPVPCSSLCIYMYIG